MIIPPQAAVGATLIRTLPNFFLIMQINADNAILVELTVLNVEVEHFMYFCSYVPFEVYSGNDSVPKSTNKLKFANNNNHGNKYG